MVRNMTPDVDSMTQPDARVPPSRMRALCREDALRVARVAPGVLLPGFCLEAFYHWGSPPRILSMVPLVNAIVSVLMYFLIRRFERRIRYPEFVLLLIWSQVQVVIGAHVAFALEQSATSSLVFFALSMAVTAMLIMPLGVMVFAFASSTLGYVITLSAVADTQGFGGLAVPMLVTVISILIHISRRGAIRQVEVGKMLAERINKKNLELTAAKRVHDAAATLAAGVAHHFNNKLQVVVGALETTLHIVGSSHPAAASLNRGIDASTTLAQLVDRLRTYAGKQAVSLQRTAVHDLLDFDRLRGIGLPSVRFQISVDATDAHIMADCEMLNRAVEELVKNAGESVQSEGSIWLGITTTETECHINVSDTGKGFATRQKITASEPFSSSDPVTRHGLGLSYVYGIVEQHGARLQIDDRPAGGSRISIVLPLID